MKSQKDMEQSSQQFLYSEFFNYKWFPGIKCKPSSLFSALSHFFYFLTHPFANQKSSNSKIRQGWLEKEPLFGSENDFLSHLSTFFAKFQQMKPEKTKHRITWALFSTFKSQVFLFIGTNFLLFSLRYITTMTLGMILHQFN